jgi:hypothetical protein
MQEMQIQLPFSPWDILAAGVSQFASLASGVWANLTPGLRLVVVLMLIAAILLPPAKSTAYAGRRRYRRRHRRNCYD